MEFDSNKKQVLCKKQNYEHEGDLYKTLCRLRYLDIIIKSNNLNYLKLWKHIRYLMNLNDQMNNKETKAPISVGSSR